MSARHPIIAITGSSGAGTTTVTTTFQQIFRREGIRAAIVHGDAFHRYDRDEMRTWRGTDAMSAHDPKRTCGDWRGLVIRARGCDEGR